VKRITTQSPASNEESVRAQGAKLAAVSCSAEPASDVEKLYDEHAGLLVAISRRRFGIPFEEAEALVHDVFVNYIRYSDEVDNPRAWLIGAIVKASCYHLRKSGKVDLVEPASLDELSGQDSLEVEQLHRAILVKQLLGYMGEDCRDLLRQHYLEGRTANELAGLLATTEGYAKKMIHKCLVRVRELYGRLRSTT
jgi:RNA polymerase sigma factor (sigma-70 family)